MINCLPLASYVRTLKELSIRSVLSAIDGDRVVPSLRELSIRSISGVSNRESVSLLMQLSNDEIFEAALLVNRKRSSFSMYEPICISEGDSYQSVIENVGAIMTRPFPIRWSWFFKQNFREPNDDSSINHKEFRALLSFISDFYLVFDEIDCFVYDRSKALDSISYSKVHESMKTMCLKINSLMDNFIILRVKIRKSLCYLVGAMLIQLLEHSLPLRYLLSRPVLSIKHIVVNHLNEFLKDFNKIRGNFLHIMHICNFVPLEEMIKTLEIEDSNLFKDQITVGSCLLERKYHLLIDNKKSKMRNVLKNNELHASIYTGDDINKLVEKLNNEIKEMEIFLNRLKPSFNCAIS
ncbi:hypothetical protein [Candidatus Ichthyocystis hellenicum]|uniref:hypothetical protein n=1 Tax=Candidatus Ichthyocystis hellenicum TaxID=1561003 RepID=UPI000B81A58F|nr:hypothetical protein [Candidatus Ichthyocystis hellenicum]